MSKYLNAQHRYPKFDDEYRFYWWDYLVFFCCAAFCVLVFCQGDIITTAEHSLILLEGHISDFYTACQEWNGAYAANYLPSTFIAFAIWNLPVYLLGMTPDTWGMSSRIPVLWYKLLPILVYFLAAYVLYRICMDCFGFSKKKAKLTSCIFIASPIAFYSQFIFSQYDIFTVFFMLLGMYYYFKEKPTRKQHLLFVVFFSIAVTFKYQVLLIFFILLLLRHKEFKTILRDIVIFVVPIVVELLLCVLLDGDSFSKAVGGFNALDYLEITGINVGFAGIQLSTVVLCCIVGYSYFIKVENHQDLIRNALYLCCGCSFGLYSFMTWYPQWLTFSVAFWVLSLSINKYFDVFLWLDTAFICLEYIFFANVFPNNVDQAMLKNGILAPLLKYSVSGDALTLSQVYYYQDVNTLFSVMVALFFIFFVFKAPKYTFSDIRQELTLEKSYLKSFKVSNIVRIRFLIPILAYVIPCMLCLPSMLEQQVCLWRRESTYALNSQMEYLKADEFITQELTLSDKYTLESIEIEMQRFSGSENGAVSCTVHKVSDGSMVAYSEKLIQQLSDSKGKVRFEFGEIELKDCQYTVTISLVKATETDSVGVYYIQTPTNDYQNGAVIQKYAESHLNLNGTNVDSYYLDMSVYGRLVETDKLKLVLTRG